jgi:sugar lactone lactonase YvrE
MRPPYGAHFSRTLGTGLTLFLMTLAACGGDPASNRKTDGGDNDPAEGSAAAGGSSAAGSAGAGGSSVAGNGGGGATAGTGGSSTAGAGGTSEDAGAGLGLDGGTCPTLEDGGMPPSGPDNVTFLANVTVTTIAGSDMAGNVNGAAAQALFSNPVSVVIEPTGSLLVCDFLNDSIRRIEMPNAAVAVSTLTQQAGFQTPFGMTYGTDGTLYVDTDFDPAGNKTRTTGTIWKVNTTTGVATSYAVGIGRPRGLALLSDGRLVLGDYENAQLLILDTTTGIVTLLAGHPGCPGLLNGKGDVALFSIPYGVVVLPNGTIIVADEDNHVLRAVTLAGDVTTYAGDGGNGTVDGPRLSARFSQPLALAVDAAGDLFVTDVGAHRIRRVAADGTVTTVAGDGTAGFMNGTGAASELFGIEGIASTSDGKTLYVADGTLGTLELPYNRVRKIVIDP